MILLHSINGTQNASVLSKKLFGFTNGMMLCMGCCLYMGICCISTTSTNIILSTQGWCMDIS
ncbi:hypothetical protein [Flavobacterium sp. '19STA2R22 D10 B1']|uniref:hypothetical protein n=1 Tax=Flavobacterium aerium TaxID=3037261 RepID=UPI00278C09DC|nr:hypothetical protein [Flavobacterium sp. '19STA2R22 D10 B1']